MLLSRVASQKACPMRYHPIHSHALVLSRCQIFGYAATAETCFIIAICTVGILSIDRLW
jgi:hypothetical protein